MINEVIVVEMISRYLGERKRCWILKTQFSLSLSLPLKCAARAHPVVATP